MNNSVTITGIMTQDFLTNSSGALESFICAERLSGAKDIIPFVVDQECEIDRIFPHKGDQIRINGEYVSEIWGNGHLSLFVSATSVEILENEETENEITLQGIIAKKPIYRKTPLGRTITNILLANGEDRIPCILWGINARFCRDLEIGTEITVSGRIQSREYLKKLEDGTEEIRTAYEVSVSSIDVLRKAGVGNEQQ